MCAEPVFCNDAFSAYVTAKWFFVLPSTNYSDGNRLNIQIHVLNQTTCLLRIAEVNCQNLVWQLSTVNDDKWHKTVLFVIGQKKKQLAAFFDVLTNQKLVNVLRFT